jgi:hypothetical protein
MELIQTEITTTTITLDVVPMLTECVAHLTNDDDLDDVGEVIADAVWDALANLDGTDALPILEALSLSFSNMAESLAAELDEEDE